MRQLGPAGGEMGRQGEGSEMGADNIRAEQRFGFDGHGRQPPWKLAF